MNDNIKELIEKQQNQKKVILNRMLLKVITNFDKEKFAKLIIFILSVVNVLMLKW